MSDSRHISVVIPVYNAESTLRELYARLKSVLDGTGHSYEIVMVNDGSSDASWEILCDLHDRDDSSMIVIDLMRNFGQHNAIMCGFHECSGALVITMDDDLQNPPEEIPKLLDAVESGELDLIYGVPERKQHQLWRNIGSELTQWFYRTVFSRPNGVSAFRIVRLPLVRGVLSYNRNFTYLDGLFAWNTQRIGEMQVRHESRTTGRSGYSIRKLVALALNLFTNFSLLPLQIVSITGFCVALGGISVGLYYLVQALLNNIAVPGYASTIVAVLLLGGVQLLSLGMLGEYLGRVHLNINQKPQFVRRTHRQRAMRPEDSNSSANSEQHS